jgi:creatinine amidohydrolase
MWLADLTWPEVAELAAAGALLAVPMGSTEQHGPHLPLSTDADLAMALCEHLAAELPDVLIAPPVPYGSSGEHAGFAGTVSIGQDATELLALELARSAGETFSRLLFVSGHGGNAEPLGRAIARLHAESRDVGFFQPDWAKGDAHAGREETAMLLALRPGIVRMEFSAPGERRPLSELMPRLRAQGVRAVSRSGVLGDPTAATAAAGAQLLGELGDALVRYVEAWSLRGAGVRG